MLPPICVVCKSHFVARCGEIFRSAQDDIWSGIAIFGDPSLYSGLWLRTGSNLPLRERGISYEIGLKTIILC